MGQRKDVHVTRFSSTTPAYPDPITARRRIRLSVISRARKPSVKGMNLGEISRGRGQTLGQTEDGGPSRSVPMLLLPARRVTKWKRSPRLTIASRSTVLWFVHTGAFRGNHCLLDNRTPLAYSVARQVSFDLGKCRASRSVQARVGISQGLGSGVQPWGSPRPT